MHRFKAAARTFRALAESERSHLHAARQAVDRVITLVSRDSKLHAEAWSHQPNSPLRMILAEVSRTAKRHVSALDMLLACVPPPDPMVIVLPQPEPPSGPGTSP